MHELQLDRAEGLALSPQAREGSIKLNLGGAGEGFLNGHLSGFLTVDLREGKDTDIVANANDLTQFEDSTVEEIYASNILEHFPIADTVKVLQEWNRVLKPKGKLYVSVPDFDAAVKLYQKVGLVTWLKYHLWGDQKHPLNYHYVCFTNASLSKDLLDAGFSDMRRVKMFGIGEKDGSTNVNTITHELISLNVVATK